MKPTKEILENCLNSLEKRAKDQSSPTQNAMNEINQLQRLLIPQNLDVFLGYLPRILETLLLCVDDKDVSIRHTASVILNSSVQVILPFKKSTVLQFISLHCNKDFKPHALVAMVDLALKVTLFLTKKVAIELFQELLPLFINISKSPSEISCEGFYKLANQVRPFIQGKDERTKIIEELIKRKSSDLATDWNMKTAAIFAHPDLIDDTLSKLKENKLQFCAALPQIFIPEIPSDTPFEFLLSFVKEDPKLFFDRIQHPPEDSRQMAPFLFCLKTALEHGFKPEFDLSILINLSIEPNISQLQMECICLGKLAGTIDCDLSAIFRQCNASSISALSLCFNRFPLPYFLDSVLTLDHSKPAVAKAIVIFLTEVDFAKFPMHQKKAVDVLADISKNGFEIVQNTLCERCPLFNCGDIAPLFMRLLESADYFDPNSFKNMSTLLSYMSSPKVDDLSNVFFAALTEIDNSVIWGDSTSLESFLSAIRRFCMHSKRIRIPQFVAMLPQLVLYIIVSLICTDMPKGSYMQALQQSYACPSGQALANVLAKQPLISLLQLRDKAAAAAAALKTQIVVDSNVLDALGKKLIPWPSANTWYLLSSSGKVFAETTGGLLSTDTKIVYAAAQLFPGKLHEVDENSSPDLIVLALEKGEDIKFTMSVPLVKAADRRAKFPTVIAEQLSGSWMTAAIKKHIELDAIKEFSKKPFSQWEGPPAFWELVPQFVKRLKSRGMMPAIDIENCSSVHMYVINRNPTLFNLTNIEVPKIDFQIPKAAPQPMEFSLDEEPLDIAPEIIRELRIQLYERAGVQSLHELIKCEKVPVFPQLPAIIHKALNECEEDCVNDLSFFTIELALAAENSDISKSDAHHLLKLCPFRSYATELVDRPWAPHRVPLSEMANGTVFTETELLALAKYQIREGRRSTSQAAIPLAPNSLGEIARLIGRQFFVCMLYGVVPPYTQENENDLTRFVSKYGVSKKAVESLKEWLKSNKPMSLLKEILSSSFNNGTFYSVALVDAIKDSVKKEDEVLYTLQAFSLASDDSVFKKLVDKKLLE